jgi:hypothetical protein
MHTAAWSDGIPFGAFHATIIGGRYVHIPVLIVHPLSGDGPCAVRRQTGERRIDRVKARRKTAVYEKKL